MPQGFDADPTDLCALVLAAGEGRRLRPLTWLRPKPLCPVGGRALLDLGRAEYLAENLPIIARQERAHLLTIGVVSTHVHLLLRLHPTTQLPRLLQRMKGGTARALSTSTPDQAAPVRWAKGYSVTSVGPRALGQAAAYVQSQPRHHPAEAIPGWPGDKVASATSAEPSLQRRAGAPLRGDRHVPLRGPRDDAP